MRRIEGAHAWPVGSTVQLSVGAQVAELRVHMIGMVAAAVQMSVDTQVAAAGVCMIGLLAAVLRGVQVVATGVLVTGGLVAAPVKLSGGAQVAPAGC